LCAHTKPWCRASAHFPGCFASEDYSAPNGCTPKRSNRSGAIESASQFCATEAERGLNRLNGGTFADSPRGFRLDKSFRIVYVNMGKSISRRTHGRTLFGNG